MILQMNTVWFCLLSAVVAGVVGAGARAEDETEPMGVEASSGLGAWRRPIRPPLGNMRPTARWKPGTWRWTRDARAAAAI
jgi:hypothetical protein